MKPLHRYPLPVIIGLILAVTGILIGGVLLLHFWKEVPIGNLTRDPNRISGLPPYTGFVSQLGIFIWSAAATVCLFCVSVLSFDENQKKLKLFLLISGLLTLMLGLDDALMLHESVFPRLLGIPQDIVIDTYVVFMLLYLFRFHRVILETEYSLMAIALVFFFISVLLDEVKPAGINPYFMEDGAKLIGLLSWLAYFVRVGGNIVSQNKAQQR